MGYKSKVFSVGDYRRRKTSESVVKNDFFSSTKSSTEKRDQVSFFLMSHLFIKNKISLP